MSKLETNQARAKSYRDYERPAYTPYGTAKQFYGDRTSEEKLISGAAGTGKSICCLQELVSELEQYPNARALIVRKTRASLSETTLVTLESHVLGAGHPAIIGGAQRSHRQKYVFSNGSEIVLAGLDNPIKIMSSEFDIAYIPEAIELTPTDWELVTTRLRNGVLPVQRLLADTNPSYENHWLLKRCLANHCRIYHAQHTDNPLIYNQQTMELTDYGHSYLSKLNRLSGVRKERLLNGKWTTATGVVYESFNPNIHIVNELPKFNKVYRVIDFGFKNPFVCLWIGEDYDGNLYVYRELYQTELLVEDAAKIINEHDEIKINGVRYREKYAATICDHDAEGRATLEKHLKGNVRTIPAHKKILEGIELVQHRLKIKDNGKPSLFLYSDMLINRDNELDNIGKPCSLRNEFDVYAWHKDFDGKENKELPVKDNDHALDALRYACAFIAGIGDAKKPKRKVRNLPTAFTPDGKAINVFKKNSKRKAKTPLDVW